MVEFISDLSLIKKRELWMGCRVRAEQDSVPAQMRDMAPVEVSLALNHLRGLSDSRRRQENCCCETMRLENGKRRGEKVLITVIERNDDSLAGFCFRRLEPPGKILKS